MPTHSSWAPFSFGWISKLHSLRLMEHSHQVSQIFTFLHFNEVSVFHVFLNFKFPFRKNQQNRSRKSHQKSFRERKHHHDRHHEHRRVPRHIKLRKSECGSHLHVHPDKRQQSLHRSFKQESLLFGIEAQHVSAELGSSQSKTWL